VAEPINHIPALMGNNLQKEVNVMAEAIIETTITTPTIPTPAERKAEIRAQVEALNAQYNEAMALGEFRTMSRLDEETKKLVKEYTSEAEIECFNALLATDDPLLEAAKVLNFGTIKVRDESDNDTNTKTRVIEDSLKTIDPVRLNKKSHEGLGANKDWVKDMRLLNSAMVTRKAAKLGIPAKDCCDGVKKVFAELARFKSTCEGVDPTSDDALFEDLQNLTNAMLGDGYAIEDRDVEYVWTGFAKKGKRALQVACSNPRNFGETILEVCHRVVTGKSYEIISKAKK